VSDVVIVCLFVCIASVSASVSSDDKEDYKTFMIAFINKIRKDGNAKLIKVPKSLKKTHPQWNVYFAGFPDNLKYVPFAKDASLINVVEYFEKHGDSYFEMFSGGYGLPIRDMDGEDSDEFVRVFVNRRRDYEGSSE